MAQLNIIDPIDRARKAGNPAKVHQQQPAAFNQMNQNPFAAVLGGAEFAMAPQGRQDPNPFMASLGGPNLHDNIANYSQQAWMNYPQQAQQQNQRAMDSWQYYADRGANRNMIGNLISALAGGIGGGGGGGGNRTGFQDKNSPNAANLATGEVTSGITTQPMSAGQIAAAKGVVAAPQPAKVQGGGGEVNSQVAAMTRNAAAGNAGDFERQALLENASLARDSEGARIQDELDKMRWLLSQDQAGARYANSTGQRQASLVNPLLSMLLG